MNKCEQCGYINGDHHTQCPTGHVEAQEAAVEQHLLAALKVPSEERLLKLTSQQRAALDATDRLISGITLTLHGERAAITEAEQVRQHIGLNAKGVCVKCSKPPDDHDGELFCGGGSYV